MTGIVQASERVVEKVFAYVTHRGRLLVFRHVESPEAGIQVPAGTLEPGETPAEGVLREATEETGLAGLALDAPLGTTDFDMTPFGRRELQRRHFFHLVRHDDAPERWIHEERHGADGGGPIAFEFTWVRLPGEVPELIAGHGAFVAQLVERLQGSERG